MNSLPAPRRQALGILGRFTHPTETGPTGSIPTHFTTREGEPFSGYPAMGPKRHISFARLFFRPSSFPCLHRDDISFGSGGFRRSGRAEFLLYFVFLYNIQESRNVYYRGAATDGRGRDDSRRQGLCGWDPSKEASIVVHGRGRYDGTTETPRPQRIPSASQEMAWRRLRSPRLHGAGSLGLGGEDPRRTKPKGSSR